MKDNCKPGDTAQIVSGPRQNQGKIVKILAPHPFANGYRKHDGAVVQCRMWQIDPPILGLDGQMYDAVADMDVRPLQSGQQQEQTLAADPEGSLGRSRPR